MYEMKSISEYELALKDKFKSQKIQVFKYLACDKHLTDFQQI